MLPFQPFMQVTVLARFGWSRTVPDGLFLPFSSANVERVRATARGIRRTIGVAKSRKPPE
jgi:hypothetical protein